jgi:hypothetical protein
MKRKDLIETLKGMGSVFIFGIGNDRGREWIC